MNLQRQLHQSVLDHFAALQQSQHRTEQLNQKASVVITLANQLEDYLMRERYMLLFGERWRKEFAAR